MTQDMEQREEPFPGLLKCSGQEAQFLPSALLPFFPCPLTSQGVCLAAAGALIQINGYMNPLLAFWSSIHTCPGLL